MHPGGKGKARRVVSEKKNAGLIVGNRTLEEGCLIKNGTRSAAAVKVFFFLGDGRYSRAFRRD